LAVHYWCVQIRSKILEEAKQTQGKLQPYPRIIESLWSTVKETPYLLAKYPLPEVFERHLIDEAPITESRDSLETVFSPYRPSQGIYYRLFVMDITKEGGYMKQIFDLSDSDLEGEGDLYWNLHFAHDNNFDGVPVTTLDFTKSFVPLWNQLSDHFYNQLWNEINYRRSLQHDHPEYLGHNDLPKWAPSDRFTENPNSDIRIKLKDDQTMYWNVVIRVDAKDIDSIPKIEFAAWPKYGTIDDHQQPHITCDSDAAASFVPRVPRIFSHDIGGQHQLARLIYLKNEDTNGEYFAFQWEVSGSGAIGKVYNINYLYERPGSELLTNPQLRMPHLSFQTLQRISQYVFGGIDPKNAITRDNM